MNTDRIESLVVERIENGLLLDGLPVYVADDDFIEHLHEMGFEESIEEVELYEEWNSWSRENLET